MLRAAIIVIVIVDVSDTTQDTDEFSTLSETAFN